jgi:hypothetical protein
MSRHHGASLRDSIITKEYKSNRLIQVLITLTGSCVSVLNDFNSARCWLVSGPGAKTPVALQPLGLLYTLFSRSSHCHRQMSPRIARSERSQQREVEL